MVRAHQRLDLRRHVHLRGDSARELGEGDLQPQPQSLRPSRAFALGFCPAPTIREIYIRFTGLERGGYLFFTVCSVALAIGAFWELLEWWTTLLVASDVGEAFLGSQGDVWDAQWDMVLPVVSFPFAAVSFDR